MKHVIKMLAAAGALCLTACNLQFADPTLSTNTESPEKVKLTTGNEIREGWGKGDKESWERGDWWGKNGVLTEESRKKLLEIAKGSGEENAKKAGKTLVQNAESIRQEYKSLRGEDDSSLAKKSAKARLQTAAADVFAAAQSGKQQEEAAEWLAGVLFSDDDDEQKIARNLIKDKKDLSPELQQALAGEMNKHPNHAQASPTAALLGNQSKLTDDGIKALILAGGKHGTAAQAGAVIQLQGRRNYIRDNYATFAAPIQTALQNLKDDTTPASANRVSMLQLATAGKTLAQSIPILQGIAASPQAGVQKDVALELVRHASTENGGGWIAAGNVAYNDLGNVSNAVVGGLAGLVAAVVPTDVADRAKIAELAWRSRNSGVAKAVLVNLNASKAIGAAADTNAKQDSLVDLALAAQAAGMTAAHYGNLHEMKDAIVGSLGRLHAAVNPGDVARRTNIATHLVWNPAGAVVAAGNAALAGAVLENNNARVAFGTAAPGGNDVAALGARLLAEVGRLFDNMRTVNSVALGGPAPNVVDQTDAVRQIKAHYPHLHLQPPVIAVAHSVTVNIAEAVRDKLSSAVVADITAIVPFTFTSDRTWFNRIITAVTESANPPLIAYLKSNASRAEVTDVEVEGGPAAHTRPRALANNVAWAWDLIDGLP